MLKLLFKVNVVSITDSDSIREQHTVVRETCWPVCNIVDWLIRFRMELRKNIPYNNITTLVPIGIILGLNNK